jgi:hypothetical protein
MATKERRQMSGKRYLEEYKLAALRNARRGINIKRYPSM